MTKRRTKQPSPDPLEEACPVCKAKPNDPCTNTIEPGHDLPGRKHHIGRTER